MQDYTSIYLHIPFCRHRCSYCDFNTYAGLARYVPAYVEALCEEIRIVGNSTSETLKVHTIFFGGGTPSILHAEDVAKILKICGEVFEILPAAEITIEANPGTISLEWLKQVKQTGVNRLSFGMQSANQIDLTILERQHDTLDVIRAVEWSRKAGICNISLDLMFGIPGQDLERWNNTLNFAIQLNPEHLSLYSLTIEPGTPFKRWFDRGMMEIPEDDQAADMYELACQRLESAGYMHYEISNWAKGDRTNVYYCRHNLQYWEMKPYLGFGAGAHGFSAGFRAANVRGVKDYIQRINKKGKHEFPSSPAVKDLIRIDRWTEIQETMMVGLRLLDRGVSASNLYKRFGIHIKEIFSSQISRLIQSGLLEWSAEGEEVLRLTRRGWLLGNQVFMEFIDLPKPVWID
jgi:oxygen-independent coproporphyrinogen-3 oxidase